MKIIYYGDPILCTRAVEVTRTGDLRKTSWEMRRLMNTHNGIGLAAPQVGLGMRLIVLKFQPYIMCNPQITELGHGDVEAEGCLSLPGIVVKVPRNCGIEVTYQDLHGKMKKRTFEFKEARVIQHEVDHLNGKLIIDYLHGWGRMKILNKLRAIEKMSKGKNG